MEWKPGGNRSGNLVPGKWNPVPGFPPEVSTRGFHWHRKISNAKKSDETGLFSIDGIDVMKLIAGWKLETGTPNWNADASGMLR
jgi:hypothetical protein